MKTYFETVQVMPDVYQIYELDHVGSTVVVGTEKAFLCDAGYGFGNLRKVVETITDKPLICALTHAHGDHVGGSRQFDLTYVHAADYEAATTYDRNAFALRGIERGKQRGVFDDNVTVDCLEKEGTGDIEVLKDDTFDLGGITVKAFHVPGHTPGSVVFYIPEKELLLTGDNWNPQTTWLFTPHAVPVSAYIQNMKKLLALPFKSMLASHTTELYQRDELERFCEDVEKIKEMPWMPYNADMFDRTDLKYIKAGMTDFAFLPENI